MDELKPCPFCGAEAVLSEFIGGTVTCPTTDCCGILIEATPEEWNRRPVTVSEGEAEKLLQHSFAMLTRYRRETPLGHQPHMIAHQADELIDKIDAYLKGKP
jgi:hypothetical protein